MKTKHKSRALIWPKTECNQTKSSYFLYRERREYYSARLWNKKDSEKEKNKKRRRKMSEFNELAKSKRKESAVDEKTTSRTTKDFLAEKPVDFLKDLTTYYTNISEITFSNII
jgi:hypothetical protein